MNINVNINIIRFSQEDSAEEDSDEDDDEDLFQMRGSNGKSNKMKGKKNQLFGDNVSDGAESDNDGDDDDDYGVGGGDRSKFYPDLEALQDWEGTGEGCAIETLRNK